MRRGGRRLGGLGTTGVLEHLRLLVNLFIFRVTVEVADRDGAGRGRPQTARRRGGHAVSRMHLGRRAGVVFITPLRDGVSPSASFSWCSNHRSSAGSFQPVAARARARERAQLRSSSGGRQTSSPSPAADTPPPASCCARALLRTRPALAGGRRRSPRRVAIRRRACLSRR